MPEAHFVGDACPGGHRGEYEEMFLPWTGQSPKPVEKPVRQVESIQFLDGGVVIAWVDSTGIRSKGSLVLQQSLAIQATDQHAALIDGVRTAVVSLLEDALEDFEGSDADVEAEEDDDDEGA